jgi:hypothetical protein
VSNGIFEANERVFNPDAAEDDLETGFMMALLFSKLNSFRIRRLPPEAIHL